MSLRSFAILKRVLVKIVEEVGGCSEGDGNSGGGHRRRLSRCCDILFLSQR